MQPPPSCIIQTELSERLELARKMYTAAVRALAIAPMDIDTVSNVNIAKLIYQSARANLVAHRKEHGC
jgi:hypothetical protein